MPPVVVVYTNEDCLRWLWFTLIECIRMPPVVAVYTNSLNEECLRWLWFTLLECI